MSDTVTAPETTAEPLLSQPAVAEPATPEISTKLSDGWISSVAKELSVEEDSLSTLRKFDSVSKLAKSYAELEKMKRPDAVIPTADAPPEAWNDFYNKLGRPESPDKYSYDGERTDYFTRISQKAHEVGITDTQFKALAEENDRFYQEAMENIQPKELSQEEVVASLKNDWGYMYQKNIEKAQVATKYLSDQLGVSEEIFAKQYSGDPMVIKMLSLVGGRLIEDSTVAPHGDTVLSIEDKIRELRNSDAYRKSDPVAMERMVELNRKKLAIQAR